MFVEKYQEIYISGKAAYMAESRGDSRDNTTRPILEKAKHWTQHNLQY